MPSPPACLSFWLAAERQQPSLDRSRFLEAFVFGNSAAMAGELTGLVLRGRKRATASLAWAFEHDDRARPKPGDLSIVTTWAGAPLCIIETTAVEVVAFEDVTAEFAAAEGEGDGSLPSWRRHHAEFFAGECRRIGREPEPGMPVVCERFRVVYRPG